MNDITFVTLLTMGIMSLWSFCFMAYIDIKLLTQMKNYKELNATKIYAVITLCLLGVVALVMGLITRYCV